MKTVGPGVRELRVRDAAGAFRVVYIATFADAIYVLHAFQKQTQRTAKRDLDVALSRLRDLMRVDDDDRWGFESVWDALEESPAEAAHMRLRSDLMIAVQQAVAAWGVTQVEAAQRLSVAQPRLSDLVRGRIGKFSLDALVDLAARAGLALRLEITRPAA